MDTTDTKRRLRAAVTSQVEGARRGLLLAGEHLKGESQQEVPHDEGTLEDTAKVTVSSDGLTVAVSYGTAYAVRQHEELDWNHQDGRKAKFLEDPLNREKDVMARLIQREVRTEMGT